MEFQLFAMQTFCSKIVRAPWFHHLIVVVILIAGAIVGIETSPAMLERAGGVLHALDNIVLGIFIVEILLKWGALWPRPWRYFADGWNVFDFIIVAGCLLPFGGPYVAVLRLFRLLRVLRLVTAVPKLQYLVTAMLKSLPSMGYVALLLGLIFYIYAVVGVTMFGANDPMHFGGLGRAMLTLFSVVTLEGWVEVMDLQRLGSDKVEGFEGQMKALGAVPHAMPLAAVAYFVSFVLVGTMVMLNLVIGVIINAMDDAHKEALEHAVENAGADLDRESDLRNRLADLRRRIGEMEELLVKRL